MASERYSRDHGWVRREGSRARVGLSDFAQQELGEMAFVELPPLGKVVRAGQPVCAVDSLKSTSEVYAPVSGTIVAVNGKLTPEGGVRLVNSDPLGEGWLFVLELSEPAELDSLMSLEQYVSYVGRETDAGGRDPESR